MFHVKVRDGRNDISLLNQVTIADLPVDDVTVPGSRHRNHPSFDDSVSLKLKEGCPQRVTGPKKYGEKQEGEETTSLGPFLQRRGTSRMTTWRRRLGADVGLQIDSTLVQVVQVFRRPISDRGCSARNPTARWPGAADFLVRSEAVVILSSGRWDERKLIYGNIVPNHHKAGSQRKKEAWFERKPCFEGYGGSQDCFLDSKGHLLAVTETGKTGHNGQQICIFFPQPKLHF